MFDVRAFDPFNEALSQSSYRLALADRAALARASSDLVQLYEGNGLAFVQKYIYDHFTDADLREKYLALATTQNTTALVVNQVATTGLVDIVWVDRESGKLLPRAQRNWERLLNDWCTSDWASFTQTVNRYTKLLRTLVVSWMWDAKRRRMVLSHYGPHQMDVGYDKGNADKLNPDRYTFLREEATGWSETWEFGDITNRIVNEDDVLTAEAGAFPVRDPLRGEPVVPFVRFSTGSSGNYFEWAGQADQISAHQVVDICWTTANVLREWGLVVVPVLSGDGWVDADGKVKSLILNLLKPLYLPTNTLYGGGDKTPAIQFVTPDVGPVIDKCLSMADRQISAVAARYGVSVRNMLGGGEAASGYAMQIDGASQRRQHIDDVSRDKRPWRQVADGLRWYWNYHLPMRNSGWEIPANATPVAMIPKSTAVVPNREGIDSAIALISAGLLAPIGTIFDSEPGIEAARAFAMADAVEARVAAGGNLLDSMGAAGATAPQPNAKPSAAPEVVADVKADEPAALPVVPAAPVEDVQAQVLNGAQMSSLQAIVQAVANKTLPAESAIALVVLAVPGVSLETAKALVNPAEKFVQPKEPVSATQ